MVQTLNFIKGSKPDMWILHVPYLSRLVDLYHYIGHVHIGMSEVHWSFQLHIGRVIV